MSADPNGWVQNPPSTFVKVTGTSREMINGKFGLVLQYASDRDRYTVVLCDESQDTVSLKPANLTACGMLEKAKAYYQMLRHNPDVRRQLQKVSQQVHQRTGLKPEHALALILLLLILGWKFLGFSRVLMLLSTIIMVLTVIGPDVAAGKDARTILRNAPARWKEVVRTQVPVVGERIAASAVVLRIMTALLCAFVVYSLVVTPSSARTRASSSGSYLGSLFGSSSSSAATARGLTVDLQQQYYKLGFDDATNQKEFGASLQVEAEAAVPPQVYSTDDLYDDPMMDPPPGSRKKKASPFSLPTAFALFTVYRTLYPIAVNAEGKFDWQLFRANLANLEAWKLGLVAFSVYRVVSAFLQ